MSVLEFHVWARSNPVGEANKLGVITDEDCVAGIAPGGGKRDPLWIEPQLHGLGGSAGFTLSRHSALATTTLLAEDNIVRVKMPLISSDYLRWGWVMKSFEHVLIDADNEQAGELVNVTGPGLLQMLAWGNLYHSSTVSDQPNRGSANVEGKWWWEDQPWGAILTRIAEEGRHAPYPDAAEAGSPLEFLSITYNRTHDSDGVAWPTITAEFERDIGTDLMSVADALRESGNLYLVMDASDVDAITLHTYQTYGRDLTGAFGAATVRFERGVNIATNLTRRIESKLAITHLLQRDKDGFYSTEVWSGYVDGDPETWGFWDANQTNDDTLLNAIAQNVIDASRTALEPVALEIMPGEEPANGKYLWGPPDTDGHFDVGDSVTVHTGASAEEYNEASQIVMAVRVSVREAAASNTDLRAQRSLKIEPQLNYYSPRYGSSNLGTGPTQIARPRTIDLCRKWPAIETSIEWKTLELTYRDTGGSIVVVNAEPSDWKSVGFDDSTWADAIAGVASPATDLFEITHPQGNDFLRRHEILYRREFYVAATDLNGADVSLSFYADDGGTAWVNGTQVATIGTPYIAGPVETTITIPRSTFVEGLNCIAIYTFNQDIGTNGTAPEPGGVLAGLKVEISAASHDLGSSVHAKRCDDVTHAALVPITDLGAHFDSGNVEGALQEVGAHIASPDAHDASDIGFTPAGTIAATNVQAAIEEVASEAAGSGGDTFGDLGWFNVEDYGAVHDGSTDDTTAIQDAIDACFAAGGGTIWFPEGNYLIGGALQDTGTYNSQLEIPQNSSGLVYLRLLGAGSVVGGSVLRSNWAGTISGTPAIISAGTHDSLTLNQVFVVFEHIRIEAPANPKLTAVDMTKAATCRWADFAIRADGGTGSVGSVPSNTNAIGLDLPWGLNDQNSGGEEVWLDGFYTGIRPSEQMVAEAIYCSFNARAVEFRGAQGSPENLAHSVSIQRLNVWFCVRGVVFTGDMRWVHIGLMDVEHDDPGFTTVYDIDDASNYGRGLIRLHTTDYDTGEAVDNPLINGGDGLSLHLPHGKRWRLASVVDIPTGTDPSTNPSSGRRIYADSVTGVLTVRKPDGSTVSLEASGGVAGGDLFGTYPNPSVVDDSHNHTSATAPGTGELLISDSPSTPLVFGDILQNESQDDLLYADS